jgi:universal stress protein E
VSIAVKDIRNILVIVDPTSDAAGTANIALPSAVVKGAALAQTFNAHLELFICEFRAGLDARHGAADRARALMLQQRREQLEQLAKSLREQDIDVSIDATFCNPLHEGVLRKLAKMPVDMVIKDTHHHSLLRRTFITNTDWQLIRSCSAPLLLVKETVWAQHPVLLAAIDPSHTNDKPAVLDGEICAWTTTLASRLHGNASALHTFIPGTLLMGSITAGALAVASTISAELIEEEKQARLQMLLDTVSPCGIASNNTHLVLGSPVETLPGESERLHVDIVVMGAISRSRMQRLFVGSTAEQVLERMPCDVLIVKPLDFASDLPF